ncbi:MAG TPA: hypothetical protein VME69_02470 [Methylocella sp.]|nr:hypothetical protein [Methylocella sp.]
MKASGVKRWSGIVALILIGLIGTAQGIVFSVQPTLAALVCPSCFGFEQFSDRVYVEPTMPKPMREKLRQSLQEGVAKVVAYYGGLHSSPIVLACASESCWQRLGGSGAQGISYASFGIRLSPQGIDPVIIAHEYSHIELHQHIGLLNFTTGTIPAWFDEGLAVIVSDDPRYSKVKTATDRCEATLSGDLPEGQMAWTRAAGTEHDLYARARCRVARWMNANGGKAAALTLIQKVAEGVAFSDAYWDPD